MAKKTEPTNEEVVANILTAIANGSPGEAAGIVMQETATYDSKQSEAGMRAVQNIMRYAAQLESAIAGTYEAKKRNRS